MSRRAPNPLPGAAPPTSARPRRRSSSQQAGAGLAAVADLDRDALGGVTAGGDGDQQSLPGPQPPASQSAQHRGDPARSGGAAPDPWTVLAAAAHRDAGAAQQV